VPLAWSVTAQPATVTVPVIEKDSAELAASARAAAVGVSRLLLEVAEDNDAARALYAAAGFTGIARRPAYYRRPDAPAAGALVLARDLV